MKALCRHVKQNKSQGGGGVGSPGSYILYTVYIYVCIYIYIYIYINYDLYGPSMAMLPKRGSAFSMGSAKMSKGKAAMRSQPETT